VKALTALGAEVAIEAGAGRKSAIPDEAYREAGAAIAESGAAAAARRGTRAQAEAGVFAGTAGFRSGVAASRRRSGAIAA